MLKSSTLLSHQDLDNKNIKKLMLCDKSMFQHYFIHKFTNNFEIIVGQNNLIISNPIDTIYDEMQYVLNNRSAGEYQQFILEEHEIFIQYNLCVKIYKFYENNKNLIEEIYTNHHNILSAK